MGVLTQDRSQVFHNIMQSDFEAQWLAAFRLMEYRAGLFARADALAACCTPAFAQAALVESALALWDLMRDWRLFDVVPPVLHGPAWEFLCVCANAGGKLRGMADADDTGPVWLVVRGQMEQTAREEICRAALEYARQTASR